MLNAAKAAWELEDGTFKADKKFLHVSTDEVYGSLENEGEYFYETTPYDPHSPYSASKASSDMLVKSYMDTYKFLLILQIVVIIMVHTSSRKADSADYQ